MTPQHEGGAEMLHDTSHDRPTVGGPDAAADSDQLARQEAIRQLERQAGQR